MINSAQNAYCPDHGIVCCSENFTKNSSENDYYNYYEPEPEPCEKFSLDGEIAGTYSKTIQAEKFNYSCVEPKRCNDNRNANDFEDKRSGAITLGKLGK